MNAAASATTLRTTVSARRRVLTQKFRAAGIDTPDLDARLVLQHALRCDHIALVRGELRQLTPDEIEQLDSLCERRIAGEPIARIVGRKEFWGLDFELGPTTLVPRPETETLVQAALLPFAQANRPLRIADLGTGSGAVLLALLHEMPKAFGVGVDVSSQACAIAARNAARLGLGDRSAFALGDFGQAFADNSIDLLVSNPPYIARDEIGALAPEVRDHDPWLALDGGPDGLDAYRAIAKDAARLLRPGGCILVELGIRQTAPVAALLQGAGLKMEAPAKLDLSGIPRVLGAIKR